MVVGFEFLPDRKQAAGALGGTFLCVLLSSSFETAGIESWGPLLMTLFNSCHFLMSLTSRHHLWDKFPYLCSFTVVIKCQHMAHWGMLRSYPNHNHLTPKLALEPSLRMLHEQPWVYWND